MGLRALDIMKNGFSFFHGMNRYSGAAFPGLRGGVLDWTAVALVMATFWRRGNAPFVRLFYSRRPFCFSFTAGWPGRSLR